MSVAVAQDAVGVVLGISLWVWFGVFVWIAPFIIAVARENRNRWQVLIVDFIPVVGWFAAMVMAFQAKPVPYPPPYAQYGPQ